MSEPILDQAFLDKIGTKYTPAAESRLAEVDAPFQVLNQEAYDNIALLFQIVQSDAFKRLADTLGPIPLYEGVLSPLEKGGVAERLKEALVPYGTFPHALYYGRCLSLYHLGHLSIQAVGGEIWVGDEAYVRPADLFYSHYRFFFTEFGQPQFKDAVKAYLRKIGVLDAA